MSQSHTNEEPDWNEVADRFEKKKQPELADQVRLFSQEKLGAVEMVALEKKLARAGEHRAALHVRLYRIEADKRRAIDTLSGNTAAPPDLLKLAKRLASAKSIGLARRLLKLARKDLNRSQFPGIYLEIFQKSALFTYKDPDLPLEWRLDRALEILQGVEDLAVTSNQETLGLAGAIYKRKWEVDGQRLHLERALFYYLRGYAQGAPSTARADVLGYLRDNPSCQLRVDEDRGYDGINAAFVLDLLAQQEEEEARRAGLVSEAARERREGARLIREEIVRSVPSLLSRPDQKWLEEEWWFWATVGEAYFGLGKTDAANYSKAIEWLVDKPRAADLTGPFDPQPGLRIPEWEYESTARQLTRLARLHCEPTISEKDFEQTDAGRTLKRFLQGDDKAVRTTFRGKFGLALSGGGFRASLFHLGVLARLAELDVLRHVEVLSCVSGGSIVGAHYYLELRHLLQTKTDDDIEAVDYIQIVERMEEAFLRGVQRNIRTRVLAEWTTNLKMIFQPGYSRTLRVGELYERELYSQIEDIEDTKNTFRHPITGPRWLPDWLARLLGMRRDKRWLNQLFIRPRQVDGSTPEFNPREQNWRRKNKVPILILNAATLNTGHNWQFTASFMGEPPSPINAEIDANYRLRRMYYDDAPRPKYENFRLGHAVAASSCVPGLFEPLILDGLYPDRKERPANGDVCDGEDISVRLVDGGVCDNQGVASLLEQDCTVLLVSDASGQMDTQNVPSRGVLGVPLRSNSILQARVRESQYGDISARQRASLLRGLMFIHLKQGLSGAQVSWKGCPSHLKESEFESTFNRADDSTGYGVAVEIQRQLAAIRTDLDSFNDMEAFALMTSAYWMTKQQFMATRPCIEGFPEEVKKGNWRFLAVADAMKARAANPKVEARRRHLDRLLNVAASCAFKVWNLSAPLRCMKWVICAGAFFAIVRLFYLRWDSHIIPARVESYLTYRTVGMGVLTVIFFAVLAAVFKAVMGPKLGKGIMRMVRWRDTFKYILAGLGMSTIGFLVARLHLHVFDKLYLCLGSLKRFQKK
jgi:predicted acylesterase/phospholipase RssA